MWRKNEVIEVQAQSFHRLKITLQGIQPPIWRVLRIGSDATFEVLHHAIQRAMGWEDSHLHQFLLGGMTIGNPDHLEDEPGVRDEAVTYVGDCLGKAKDVCTYEYDFGDSWSHTVQVEAIEPRNGAKEFVVCLAGARACPPEDCGGAWGYQELVELTKKARRTPEEQERVDWAGEFDPEGFSAQEATKRLARIKPTFDSPKRSRARPRRPAQAI